MSDKEIEFSFLYSRLEPCRIDKYLVEQLPNYTRSKLQQLIQDNYVLVNQKPIKANYQLKNQDEIIIFEEELQPSELERENIPLDIYYEDHDIIVLNKPSGMVVHPAVGNYHGTLVNALLYHCTDLSGINGIVRAGIVHRIDKDTSGLLVACKNDEAHQSLSEQFANHTIKKVYYAICYGVIPHNIGKIDAPIGRNPQFRQQMSVVEKGKNAITHFKVLERFDGYTFLEITIETGRTHQIRVHMKYINHPLLGDPVYGPKKVYGDHGQFLHAKKLGFIHPRTKEAMEFDCPLPDYFEEVLTKLRNNEKI